MSDEITGPGGVNVEEPAPKEPYVAANGRRRSTSKIVRRYIGVAAIAVAIVVIALGPPEQVPQNSERSGGPGRHGSSSTNGGVASAAKGANGGKIGSGTTVNGIKCTPDVQQFTGSVYVPPCMSAWSGNNGGATAHGVTASTITLFYRYYKECATPTSYCQSNLNIINSLVAYFNKQYETYGRQVVVKAFHGQGSVYAEADNEGQPQAQADAQTAYDLGAFAEATSFDYPPLYQALASKGILTFGDLLPTIKTLQNYAPYVYSEVGWPLAENWANAATQVACNRMKGMDAIYSGDPAYQKEKRVFGLVISNDPDWGAAGSLIQHSAGQCGINIVNHETYQVNITGEAAEATPIIAQLKASGVTTILCGADTLMTAILMEAVAKQHYFPEWLIWEPWIEDRTAPPTEEAHTIKISSIGPDEAYTATDAYAICQLAKCNPRDLANAETAGVGDGNGADGILYNLMWIFDGIQMAGPNLTPQTFFKGFENLPCTTGSEYGTFCYGSSEVNGVGSQPADFVISAWDPNVVNPSDHAKGNWLDCENATRFKYPVGFGTVAGLGSGSQLNCPSLASS